MITNKHFGLHLSPVILFALLGMACATKEPEVKAPEAAPPVQEAVEPEEPVVQAAEPAPPVPVATPIRPGVPDRYTVKKGDTLWDISSHFLKDPWLWPEVWHINPAIRNPHLIYPGDVIALTWVDGKPVLTLEGAEAAPPPPPRPDLKVVKLSPEARVSKLDKAINTIPKSAIEPFLRRPYIIDEDDLDDAAYIVANQDDNVIIGKDSKVYALRIQDGVVVNFNIVRKGRPYIDPETEQLLGYEAVNLGKATLRKLGNPSTIEVTDAYKEILKGDYLLPEEDQKLDLNFFPRAPGSPVAGRIISVAEGMDKIGQFNVIVINRGYDAGLEPGHVLEVFQEGLEVKDVNTRDEVKLPEERAGLMMVFKPYKNVSYGLVMEAYRSLKVLDYVYSP
jgi:hypothetical protein